jgi:hypothetical protein
MPKFGREVVGFRACRVPDVSKSVQGAAMLSRFERFGARQVTPKVGKLRKASRQARRGGAPDVGMCEHNCTSALAPHAVWYEDRRG